MEKKVHSRAVVTRFNMKEALIPEERVESLTEFMRMFVTSEVTSTKARENLENSYGFSSVMADRKPFVFFDGIAVIPVHGVLINRFSESWGFVTGYNFIRAQLNAALADDDVTQIILDIDSPGGEAAGCPEIGEEIFQARSVKTITAVVDSDAYSGGYWLASACSKIILTPSGGVGSVGAISVHFSVKDFYASNGIEVTVLKAGDHKADGNPFEKLSAEVKAEKLQTLAEIRDIFATTVARNRGLDVKVIMDTEARCYRADAALDLGLIDAVLSSSDAVSSLLGELGDDEPEDDTEEDVTMTKTAEQIAAETAAAQAAETERTNQIAAATQAGATAATTRISDILDSDEAKERPALAKHFAFKTAMSAADAKAGLAVAAKETVTGGGTPKPPKGKETVITTAAPDAFAKAMDNGEQPNLTNGEDELDAKPGDDAKPVQLNGHTVSATQNRLLGDYAKVTGRTVAAAK